MVGYQVEELQKLSPRQWKSLAKFYRKQEKQYRILAQEAEMLLMNHNLTSETTKINGDK